jgi:hypothetical protein
MNEFDALSNRGTQACEIQCLRSFQNIGHSILLVSKIRKEYGSPKSSPSTRCNSATRRTSDRRSTPTIRVENDSSKRFHRLLKLWKMHRMSCEPISDEERKCLSGIIFEQMPSQRVHVVTMERLYHPDLLQKFVTGEATSLMQERDHHISRQEFMALHGTRWEQAQFIREKGLNPDFGHLGRGTWLGQNALSAHSYAAKGPGPIQSNGGHLFVLFVVACIPDSAAGDMERSFGVWRIMSGPRMHAAYMITYSAPLDVRAKQPFPSPRMNRSYELRIAENGAFSPPSCTTSPMEKLHSDIPKSPSAMSQDVGCTLPWK